ncbi:hypothetical protein ACFY4A_39035, partial [Streptomyces sp. NPDC001292]
SFVLATRALLLLRPRLNESSSMPDSTYFDREGDEEITTWVDTTAFGGQKFDALAAHASQGENIFFLKMGRKRFTELMGVETFVRVQDTTGAAVPENDLFAGLR